MKTKSISRIAGVILIVLFLALPSALASADTEAKEIETLKRIRAVRTDARLKIDGNLSEPAWSAAPMINDFRQQEPDENSEPSHKTEVRVLYDENFIYFGITCFDDVDEIIAFQMEKDSDPEADDFVGVMLDTFNDKRNGYIFAVSPAGMKFDGMVYNNSEHIDGDWDGIWYSKATILEDRWEVEIAIPFKTLTFDPENDTWGINFMRQIKRKEEIIKWSHPYLDAEPSNPALAGEITGLSGMKQGIGLDIRPFGVVNVSRGEDEQEGKFGGDGGVDFFYNITSNLKVSVTLNTDFAETEVDSRQINLSRFPITFPEKRDFFLEGSGLFEIPRMHRDVIPFFTRRIGLYDELEVPIQWGAKVTGRVGPYNIGFLNVRTGSTDDLDPQNLMALRMTRNLWEQSHIGMIFTSGNPSGEGYNRLYGVDFRYGTSKAFGNKNLYISANYLKTEDETLPAGDSDSWKISLDFPNDLIDGGIDYWEIGENFNPAMGYVRRAGIKTFRTFARIGPRPDISWIRQLSFFGYLTWTWDRNTGEYLEGVFLVRPLGIHFESGDYCEFEIIHKYDNLDEEFEITDGIFIPIDEYSFTKYKVQARTSGKRLFFGHASYSWGDYYDGTVSELSGFIGFKPSKHLFASVFIWMSDIELPHDAFVARITGVNLIVKISPDLSIKNIVQYDNDSKILGVYSKVRWIVSEGNELFIVAQHNWEKENETFEPYNWRIDLKYQHTFRF